MRRTTTLAALAALVPSLGATVAVSPAQAAGPTCDGKAATIVVPSAGRFATGAVTGTPGDDVIVGTSKDDTIDGAGGQDTICGRGGRDEIDGGRGDDRLFGGRDGDYVSDHFHGDRVAPGPGDDYVDLGHDPQAAKLWFSAAGLWDQISFRDAAGPVVVDLAAGTATGEGTDTIAPIVHAAGIEGSPHDDVLSGTDLGDWIIAGGGDDTVDGRGGVDRIDVDSTTRWPHQRPRHSPGDDTVAGGTGRDFIKGGHGTDRLSGGKGHDAIRVQDGERTRLFGGRGRDLLGGFSGDPNGHTILSGGRGNDTLAPSIVRSSDRASVRGNRGRDRLYVDLWRRAAPRGSRVVVNARKGTVRTSIDTVVRFSKIEHYGTFALPSRVRLTWYGSNRRETFRAGPFSSGVRAFGRGGKDKLVGGRGKDVLNGGRGRDTLKGHGARDRCLRGERLRSCERRG